MNATHATHSHAHGAKWPRKAEAAALALLEAPTVADAARACGVSERTLHRWLRDEAFQKVYRRAARGAFDEAAGRLRHLARRAVAVLERALNDQATVTQLRGAQLVLEHAKNAELSELADRLAAVEARQAGR